MQEINQNPVGPDGGLPARSAGGPPMPPKEGEMARPAEPPKEQSWDLIKKPPAAPEKAEPAPGPELAYKGNLREFSYAVRKQVREDMGTRLTAAERAGVTKIFSRRGGKFMGTRMERKQLKEFAAEQGWSTSKTRRILREAKNLKGKTRAA